MKPSSVRLTISACVILSVLVVTLTASPAAAQGRWIGTWTTGPLLALEPPAKDKLAEAEAAPNAATPTQGPAVDDPSDCAYKRRWLPSTRSRHERVYGTEPLKVGAAHVAQRQSGSMIAA